MGREIVYCWKCATKLQGDDFASGTAFRVGDKVSCPSCVDELVADLPAEEQEAILAPPRKPKTQTIKKITSTQVRPVSKPGGGGESAPKNSGTSVRTKGGPTGPVPKTRSGATGPTPKAASTGVRKKVTASIPKAEAPPEDPEATDEKPPMSEKKKKLLLAGGIGGGLFLVILVLTIIVLTRKPPVQHSQHTEASEEAQAKVPVAVVETPKERQAKALIKEAFDLKRAQPDALGLQLKKFRAAQAAAEGTSLAADLSSAVDDVIAKIDKAILAIDDQVKVPYTNSDFKTVIESYQKAKPNHDVPEWTNRIDTKISLVRNKVDDTFHQLKKQIELAQQAGEDPKIAEAKAIIAKWEMPDYTEQFEKFLALLASAEPGKNPADPDKSPGSAPKARTLSPAMQAFMPAWQNAITLAFGRDYASAVTEMSGAAARAESEEAKKAGAEDVQTLKAIIERYPDILKAASEAPKLQPLTLEYQDAPGVWKKVVGKAIKVDPTRMEFKPDPKDGKDQPAILIEFFDLNAGSLATLYSKRKGPLSKADADLLVKFALIEGATESAQALGGSAPDRYWIYAADAREKAPKPNSREFEARTLFHQSEFEWRKSMTKYNAIEKSKLLLSDYTSTAIVKKYQPAIAKRAETGKEFTFLPSDLLATGDYNQFKILKKEDPAWVNTKDLDFRDQLFNYIEAEFIALPGLTYKCWVYAGGCCQEVWNGSYQTTEGTTTNRGKQVAIDPGSQMAAPLPFPSGLKKTHEEHKPKGTKEHPKTATKWDWIQIPLPKTFLAPGAKQVRILTNEAGFAIKYVIISSSRAKAPDEETAKELAKEATSGAAVKPEVKGTSQPKEWYIIGPFPEGLATEQPPEKEIDLTKDYKGKIAKVRWKLATAVIKGDHAQFDWDKGGMTPKDNVSAYALIHVKSPAALEARLLLSHDDGGRVWLNGQKVHESNKTGAMKADEFNVSIKLEEGWNRLLFKVSNASGGFGLMMRIADAGKAPIPALEYSPYGDMLEPP